ncbi:P-loop containing nucleoside triphosphate hydrolase protein [Rutstroemia sp. NJR-2017a BBW]|nr:P-loop containing nucleoside triphosphate hydrolase protein [Rutstroemia sp. NJR-2017a BBW]
MGINPPFLYDPVRTDYSFDPKAVSRASLSPPAPRPKRPDGPLVSFNQHPDSYLIVPYGNINAEPMDPSVKKRVKLTRWALLGLRCVQLPVAVGLLVIMILITGVNASTGWILRVAPGVATLHTAYGVFHLMRRPGGRTPGSSASYMVFASIFDVSIVPFYAFSALVAKTRHSGWKTLLSNQNLLPTFIDVVFYAAIAGGALHLISLSISAYLAMTFRKIAQLPPDMNPLEDNLTSRHKRNKSSISTVTTTTFSEKRLSEPFESRRRSGAPYEDLTRAPTVPFLHTRTNSNESFQSKTSSPRTSRHGSPARYQAHSPLRDSNPDFKRSSNHSYASLPISEPSNVSYHTATESKDDITQTQPKKDPWANDSIGKSNTRAPRVPPKSPTKSSYHPLPADPSTLAHSSDEDDDEDTHSNYHYHLPNPLAENPPTPRPQIPSSTYSTDDIADAHAPATTSNDTEWPLRSPTLRELTPKPLRTRSGEADAFKARSYGELKARTPPVMVGGTRQVSSGVDLGEGLGGRGRDVSGKVAEEGRAGVWGARFRRVSGLTGLQIS